MFCTKCGNQIVDGSSFCTQCGAKVEEDTICSSQSSTIQGTTGYTLIVTRQKKFTGGIQSAKVTINGIERGTLANGQANTYSVDTPIIDVKISMLGVSSLHLRLHLNSNAHIQFKIERPLVGFYKISLVSIEGATIIK